MSPRLLPLLALIALLVGAPAAAASADDPERLEFEGTWSGQAFSPDGEPGSTYGPHDIALVFACVDGTCTVVEWNGEPDAEERWSFTNGSGSWQTPFSGSVCAETEERATHGTLAFDGTTLEIRETLEPTPIEQCADGTAVSIGTNENVYLLTLVARTAPTTAPTDGPDAVAPGVASRPFTEPTVYGGLDTAAVAVQPANLVWAAVGTVILALLIAIPTHLFNSAAETLADRIRGWWLRMRGRTEASAPPTAARSGWALAGAGVAIAAVISAFADPDFALDAAGLRVLLSLLVAFAIEVVLGWVAVILLVRRTHPTATATVRFAPLSLLLVAAAVGLTRLTGFEPPIVFGLVAGVAFGGLLGTADRARVALIGLGWSFGVGLVAWLVYSVLPGDAVVARELLATAAIAGLSTVPIALLPLRGLAGRTVWEASRRVWVAAYAIGLFAFLLVLLPLPASWAEIGFGIWAWVGLYLLYAVGALAVWVVVVRPWRTEAGS